MKWNWQQQQSALAIVARCRIPIVVIVVILIVIALQLFLYDAHEPFSVGSQGACEPPHLVPSRFLIHFFSLLTLPHPRCLPTLPITVVIVRCYVVV